MMEYWDNCSVVWCNNGQ